jgi:Rrf2 family protein
VLARGYGGAKLTTESLSASENVSGDYVNQILLRLKRAGLVESHRGAGGGYCLSRSPAKITLGQVVRAVEGSVLDTVCDKYEGPERDCHHQGGCAISPVWKELGRLIEGFFDGITLDRLVAETGSCAKVAAMLERIPTGKSPAKR